MEPFSITVKPSGITLADVTNQTPGEPPCCTLGMKWSKIPIKYTVALEKEWILLDTQSTMSVFNNTQFFTNIQDSKETLCAISNEGYQE